MSSATGSSPVGQLSRLRRAHCAWCFNGAVPRCSAAPLLCRPIMAAQLPPTEGFFGVGSFLDGMDGKV